MVSHSSPFAFPSLRAILSLQPQLQAALSLCPHCGRRLGRREWATAFNAQQPRAVLVTRSRMCFCAFLKTSSRRMSRSRSKRRRYRVTRRVTRAIISSSRRFFPWCSTPLTTSRSTGQEGTSSSPLSHHRCWHKGRHLSHFQRRPAERKQALPSGRSGHAQLVVGQESSQRGYRSGCQVQEAIRLPLQRHHRQEEVSYHHFKS